MMAKRLIFDVGNSLFKMALMDGGQIIESAKWEGDEPDYGYLDKLIRENSVSKAIISSVRHHNSDFFSFFNGRGVEVVKFTVDMPLPIVNGYATPSTLGRDRLAAALGAVTLFGDGANIMVVDLGSAITIDMVLSGRYVGGNISPGAALRYRALNSFTEKLPLLSLECGATRSLFSDNTSSAIASGVEMGILYELEGYILRAEQNYGEITIIFTGGDGKYFAEKIKNTIFVSSDLVIVGLNRVVDEIESREKEV